MLNVLSGDIGLCL